MGIFFITEPEPDIDIEWGFSTYKDIGTYFKPKCERTALSNSLNLVVTDSTEEKTDVDHIKINIKTFIKDNKQYTGVYLVNTSDSFSDAVFQCGMRIKVNNSKLLPQDAIKSDATDTSLFENLKVYGVGKGVSVDWNSESLNEIWTEAIPSYDVPKIQSVAQSKANLSIEYLADPEDKIELGEYISNLKLFHSAYHDHLKNISLEGLSGGQEKNIHSAKEFSSRVLKGINYLDEDPEALIAFKLMNLSILTMFARKSGYEGEHFYSNDPDKPAPQWRDFQIAFCLASIIGIIEPELEKKDREIIDLIWFPTGGGKTEAYLALLSFTIFLRRLRNPKNVGLTGLMRYTLRLLVQDQFSRLAQLVVVMDYMRKIEFMGFDLGDQQISLGLFVGQETSPKSVDIAIQKVKKVSFGGSRVRTQKKQLPFILDKCPWCNHDLVTMYKFGSKDADDYIDIPEYGYVPEKLKQNNGKPTCNNPKCGYSLEKKSPLPILQWETEVLSHPPTVLIGTVDNFAKIAWENYETQNFFNFNFDGYDCSPPDLIIQDELHLISGPLGSLVGLYDQLIKKLCSKDSPVKIAVSSATISNAAEQTSKLYGGRNMQIIPPPEKDWGESFYAN